MQLIDFPEEILLKIISDSSILSIKDLLSLSLCGRRLGYLALPQIYTSISVIDNISTSNINQRLKSLNNILTTCPQRRPWLNTALFSRTGENVVEVGQPWLTQAKMFGILTQLPALRSLGIGENIQKSFLVDAVVPLGPAKLLLQYTSSFQYLRRLTLDDFMITTTDIAEFMAWPNLLHLTVVNFIMLYSEETLSPSQKSIVAPKSNLQTLEFRGCHHNPFVHTTLMSNLLQNQTGLRTLVVESKGYFRSPAAIQTCLSPIRDTLVKLELTIIPLPETSRTATVVHNDGSILDLSDFKVLRKVVVEDHLLFAWPQDQGQRGQKWTSYHTVDTGLPRRLPSSLESLTVSRPCLLI